MTIETSILVEGLIFPEGPRWYKNKLWFSDMEAMTVMNVDLEGNLETVVRVPGRPSGLGWLPDGRMLIVSMLDRRLLRLDQNGLKEIANLKELATYHCNDMVVDKKGNAYIGNFGFDLSSGEQPKPAEIILVSSDGQARIVADNLMFPNGTVITPDGKTLIVGETWGAQLTAFDIEPDGALSNRRVWASTKQAVPDGICLDEEGAIWIASPLGPDVIRIQEGGEVIQRITTSAKAYACMLGGPDRKTLFICTSEPPDPFINGKKQGGRIETIAVNAAGVGLP